MTAAALKAIAAAMTEAELQTNVIELAHTYGWLVVHQRPALTTSGYRTAIQGDKRFPDLVMAKRGRVLLAELKSETGRLAEDQQRWVTASGAYVWRPSNWLANDIHRVLSREPVPTVAPAARPGTTTAHLPAGEPQP
jgi:hypothetical protein